MDFVEAMIVEVSRAVTPERPIQQLPFPRIDYHEALERYGSDKPDLRFGMELVDLAPALAPAPTGFGVFDNVLTAGGRVKGIVAPGMADATRHQMRSGRVRPPLRARAGARISRGGRLCPFPVAKFLGEGDRRHRRRRQGQPGDLV
jgi:aspartyl-tRNA synthetase